MSENGEQYEVTIKGPGFEVTYREETFEKALAMAVGAVPCSTVRVALDVAHDPSGEFIEIAKLEASSFFKLSTRASKALARGIVGWNALKDGRFATVGDVVKLTRKDLLGFRNMGEKSLREIESKLAEHGLKLAENVIKRIP